MTRVIPTAWWTVLAALMAQTSLLAAPEPAAVDNPQSLAGQWRFAMDRDDVGVKETWFTKDLADKIKLPGILQGQGYGDDISVDTPWVSSDRLGPAWWKTQPENVRAKYSQPGHVEVPFLSQPAKHYLGVAWYQRDITIPDAWKDQRVVIFLERAHWQSTVYVDDHQYGYEDSLVAPHVTDLGVLTPGTHRLSIRVDNRTMLPDDKQHLLDGHSVSDSLGATWNGIVGRIELSATTPVWIADAQVFPNVEAKTAHIVITIGNRTGKPGTATLKAAVDFQHLYGPETDIVGGTTDSVDATVTWDNLGGRAVMDVPVTFGAIPWDEYHPALQHITLTLNGGGADDTREVTFGMREISYKEHDILLNGNPINLRTTHDGGEFPLTGYPSMDVAAWKKIIQTCKDYGLNGMRFHSWCPPEAAFTAADELGFYLQPECGMWNAFDPGSPMVQRLEDETARLLKAYGNHPSFILLSPSNEPKGNYTQVTPQWAVNWYKKDNRRLYSAGTGWSAAAQVNGPQYASMPAFGTGQLRNSAGWFGKDFASALTNVHIPVLSHEVGQWCAYPDFSIIKKFTGYLRPSNYDIFRDFAQDHDLLQWNSLFAWASGKFQVECYKEDIEANLRTLGLAGFQLLDLHDYLGQGTALIGVLDAFWDSKGYVTPAEFRRFAGPTVPLARLSKRIFTTAETLTTDVELYNYGEAPLPNVIPYWKIVDAKGKTVAAGDWDERNIPLGKNIPLGQVTADLSMLKAPAAYKLEVGVQGTDVKNDWNIWVYPAKIDDGMPAGVTVTTNWSEARTALAAGSKVLFMPTAADLDAAKSPPMQRLPVFWNRQMNPKLDAMLGLVCDKASLALAEFPTEVYCDWQWTQIVNGVPSVNLNDAPHELRPIVWAIDDWNRDWRLGVIFEAKVGPGSLLVSAINLNNDHGGPVLEQLRRSLFDYAGSNKFQPTTALTPDEADKLWVASASPAPAPALPKLDTANPNSDVYEGPAVTPPAP